ncbi:MAG: hypothetical protein Q9218_003465 [Villophora microphyllina]
MGVIQHSAFDNAGQGLVSQHVLIQNAAVLALSELQPSVILNLLPVAYSRALKTTNINWTNPDDIHDHEDSSIEIPTPRMLSGDSSYPRKPLLRTLLNTYYNTDKHMYREMPEPPRTSLVNYMSLKHLIAFLKSWDEIAELGQQRMFWDVDWVDGTMELLPGTLR